MAIERLKINGNPETELKNISQLKENMLYHCCRGSTIWLISDTEHVNYFPFRNGDLAIVFIFA